MQKMNLMSRGTCIHGVGGGGDFIVMGVLDCGIMYLRMHVRRLVFDKLYTHGE